MTDDASKAELDRTLDDLSDGVPDARAAARTARVLAESARRAGARAVGSGRWLAELVVEMAPRIPVRDLATLQAHHGGLSGDALATALIRSASRASAAVGAASGALMGAEAFLPPAWLAIPLELVVETLAVVAIELKLVAELHAVFGRPMTGTPTERAGSVLRAWAARRGLTPEVLSRGGVADALGRRTRNELVKLVRRRIVRRLGRNISSAIPLLAGAVAGAEVNRRATVGLGEQIARDLSRRELRSSSEVVPG